MVDTPWLKAQGIDPKSIHDYVARGWLERVVRGVYRRPLPEGVEGAGEVSWEVVLLSLQRLMNYAVHLGGESALDLAGYAHYLSLGGTPRVQYHGDVPSWLKRLPLRTKIVVRRRTLFGEDGIGIVDAGSGAAGSLDVWRWPIKASSPERAILEALDELPRDASFENLDKVFEGLRLRGPDHAAAGAAHGAADELPQREGAQAVLRVRGKARARMVQVPGYLEDRFWLRAAGACGGWQASPRLPHLRAAGSGGRETRWRRRRCLSGTWRRSGCC